MECRVTENEEKRKFQETETTGASVNTEAEATWEGIGACRFCGQIARAEGKSQEERNVQATLQCDCLDAQEFQRKVQQEEKARENIRGLLSQEYPEAAGLLEEAIQALQEYKIASIQIDTGRGMKAKMAITGKGKIKVEAVVTQKMAREG